MECKNKLHWKVVRVCLHHQSKSCALSQQQRPVHPPTPSKRKKIKNTKWPLELSCLIFCENIKIHKFHVIKNMDTYLSGEIFENYYHVGHDLTISQLIEY